MKIIFITQDDNFYLPIFFNKFLSLSSSKNNFTIKKIYLLPSSPNTKKSSLFKKGIESLFLFGFKFFIFFSLLYFLNKIFSDTLKKIFSRKNLDFEKYNGSINSKSFLKKIKAIKPNLIISLSCNQLFKNEILNIPDIGCINIHSSLLPKDRGLMPSFWALCKNHTYTGVSVFFMNEYLDDGPIIYQKKYKINDLSLHSLLKKNKTIAAECLIKSLKTLDSIDINSKKNSFKLSTYNYYPLKKDVKLFYKNKKRFF